MRRRPPPADDLPIKLGPCSNGEFVPPPPSPVVTEAVRRANVASDDAARRLGLTRRRFLVSVCGSAVALLALDACHRQARPGQEAVGRYRVDPEGAFDPDAAGDALRGDEFILDAQCHLLELGDSQEEADFIEGFLAFGRENFGDGFTQERCDPTDPAGCFTTDHFLEEMFLRSDTSVALLSSLPVGTDVDPLSIEVMARARAMADRLCEHPQVLISGHAHPTLGGLGAGLDAMSEAVTHHDLTTWKIYTHIPPEARFWLDDHDPALDAVGEPLLERIADTGVSTVCIHKGYSAGIETASPVDIGPAAAAHPDLAFLVYHSAHEAEVSVGPFDPSGPHEGTDRLIASTRAHGIGPGGNVYAELGATWRLVMGDPDQAAHLIGKLLNAFGEDNVLWGTDSIWFGSPQDQIQAFRALEITEWAQERFGYPPLTARAKEKILGQNAARLFGVDPATVRCRFTRAELEEVRLELPPDRVWGPTATRAPLR